MTMLQATALLDALTRLARHYWYAARAYEAVGMYKAHDHAYNEYLSCTMRADNLRTMLVFSIMDR